MNKNILVLVGSLTCVALLGYFTYSTVSTLMKSKSVSQEVTVTEDTSSENKDKNSQDDLSERLKETDQKKEENKNNTDEKKSEKLLIVQKINLLMINQIILLMKTKILLIKILIQKKH